MVAQNNLILPRWRRDGRSGAACLRHSRLIPTERENAFTEPGRIVASPRVCGAPRPSLRAMFLNSLTATQSANMIAPLQTPITPVTMRVLPVLNSLIGIPKPIASRPAKTSPIPTTNITNIIEPTPAAAP